MSTSLERQQWCEKAVFHFREHFSSKWWTIPQNVRISVGIPKHSGHKKAIGQCWPMQASSDGFYEIFTSPEQGSEQMHLETIAHELVHATVGTEAGHKGAFKACATAVGFIGPMTSTPAGPEMIKACQNIINSIGYYPAGRLDITQRKKKGTYLLKCECPQCDYITYTTAKHLAKGSPLCPLHCVGME